MASRKIIADIALPKGPDNDWQRRLTVYRVTVALNSGSDVPQDAYYVLFLDNEQERRVRNEHHQR